MPTDWLAASSFERTHEVLSAINTLSIHAKLALAELGQCPGDAEVRQARERLIAFLGDFATLLRGAEQHDRGVIVGADPRMGELALQYLAEKRRATRRSALYTMPLTELAELVRSERSEDLSKLVACLRDLRSLVERHAHADVVGILGDI